MKSRALYQREWRKRNPGKAAEYCKSYKKKNYDFCLELTRNWKNKNKEKLREYHSIYTKTHLKEFNCYVRNRRAKLKQLPGKHTFQDIVDLLEKQNYLCNGCKSPLIEYEVDHIIPVSRNGTNWPDNLQILCPHCNAEKHDKTMDEWLKSRKE